MYKMIKDKKSKEAFGHKDDNFHTYFKLHYSQTTNI